MKKNYSEIDKHADKFFQNSESVLSPNEKVSLVDYMKKLGLDSFVDFRKCWQVLKELIG